jgi:hypothetical protein
MRCNNKETYPFESVRHLENTVVSTVKDISIRAGMEYLRPGDINISSHFDLKDQLNSIIYKRMMNVTRYKDIPHLGCLLVKGDFLTVAG